MTSPNGPRMPERTMVVPTSPPGSFGVEIVEHRYPSTTDIIKDGRGTPGSRVIFNSDGTIAGTRRVTGGELAEAGVVPAAGPAQFFHPAGRPGGFTGSRQGLVNPRQAGGSLKTRVGAVWRSEFAAPDSEAKNTRKRLVLGALALAGAAYIARKYDPYDAFLNFLPPRGSAGVEKAEGNVLMAGVLAGQIAVIGAGIRLIGPRNVWEGTKAVAEGVGIIATTVGRVGVRAVMGTARGGKRAALGMASTASRGYGSASATASAVKGKTKTFAQKAYRRVRR